MAEKIITRSVDIGGLVKEKMILNIELKGHKVFQARLFIGKMFLFMAAKAIGCGIEIDDE